MKTSTLKTGQKHRKLETDRIISTIELKKVINPLDDKETFQKAAKSLIE